MGTNEAEMERLAATLHNFLMEGKKEIVRRVHQGLVRATPKDTGYASGWKAGVGGPPNIVLGRPKLPRYALVGAAEIDQVVGSGRLGDKITLVSQAIYIKSLAYPNRPRWGSDQATTPFIPPVLDDARRHIASWKYKA